MRPRTSKHEPDAGGQPEVPAPVARGHVRSPRAAPTIPRGTDPQGGAASREKALGSRQRPAGGARPAAGLGASTPGAVLAEVRQDLNRGRAAPVYLLVGEDEYHKQKALDLLRSGLGELHPSDGGTTPWGDRVYWGGESPPVDDIVTCLRTGSLFGGSRLVIIRDCDKMARGLAAELGSFLGRGIPRGSHLILVAGSLDAKADEWHPLSSLWRVLRFDAPPPPARLGWLKARAGEMGLKLEPAAAAELLALSGSGGFFELETELLKLAAYANGEEVSGQTVRLLTSRSSPQATQNAIFEFVDLLMEGAGARALEKVHELIGTGRAPLSIVGMVARQLRLILTVLPAAERGLRVDEIARELKIKPFVARKLAGQAAKTHRRAVESALGLVLRANLMMKKGSDPVLLLERLISALCEKER